jgi:hypothetical protein
MLSAINNQRNAAMTDNRQIVLAQLPGGDHLGPQHFRLNVAEAGTPGDGEVLLKVLLRQPRRRQPRLDAGRHLPRGDRGRAR